MRSKRMKFQRRLSRNSRMSLSEYDHHMNGVHNLPIKLVNKGWHFCLDFDGLLIHKSHDEYQHCNCFN